MFDIKTIMLLFAMLGALDRIIGNRFGLGKEFEKGFMLLGNMALSMIGMIVLSPWLAEICKPVFDFVANTLHLDPSSCRPRCLPMTWAAHRLQRPWRWMKKWGFLTA